MTTPAHVESVYELTPLQQGMLLHTLSAPGSAMYFEQISWQVSGPLDRTALAAAWQRVVDRHAVLRTSFHWEKIDKPLQIVRREARAPFYELDWRQLPPDAREGQLQAFLADDRRRGFDLTAAPLARLGVIQLDADQWRVVWSFHHLLLDGWSLALVLRELFVFYDAAGRGAAIDLPAPPPFRGYIAWLQRQDPAAAEAFWRDALAGLTAPTSLPALPPPTGPSQDEDYREHQAALTPGATEALQRFARAQRLTVATLVQGAWALLLARYSGDREVLFGAVTAGRPTDLPDADAMVGLFINTVPLRARITGADTVGPWLKALQEAQARTRQFEHTPLVEIQGWSAVPRTLPLFTTILAFENYPIDRDAPGGGAAIGDLRLFEKTNYPLSVAVKPGAALSFRLLYDARQFDDRFVARAAGHFRRLLEELPLDAGRRVVDVPMLTDAERASLADWNRTGRDYPRAACLHDLFEAHARRAPDAPAVIAGPDQLTYGELDERASQLAQHLIERGLRRGGVVAVLAERGFDLVVAFLGALKAGGVYLPLDPSYPAERLTHMAADAGPAFVLTQDALAATGAAVAAAVRPPHAAPQVVRLDVDRPVIARAAPRRALTPRDAAYVIYTSGSTGRPKGVVLEHAGLCNVAAAQGAHFGVGPGERVLQFSSASFDASIFDFVMALASGAALVLARREQLLGGELTRLLRDQRVTVITVPPSALAAVPVADVPALRTIAVAGEACPPQLVESWAPGRRFFNLYGPTEDTIWTTAAECRAGDAAVTIGRPIGNHRVYVLDRHLQPVPVGVPGEMFIGGDGVARGYLHQPALTAERFVPDPFGEGGRLYRTGDRVRLREDGSLEFMGRLDHQVKVRGFRIELGEIDAVLAMHPAVKHAVTVVAGPAGDRVVSYVVAAAPGQALPLDALRAHLRERLPDYMVPSAFVELDALPVNANGKVDRAALPAASAERQLAGRYLAPRTEREAVIAAIWRDVLGVDRVGVRDNFFDLGGHSLLLIKVHSRLVEALAAPLPIVTLFECPTVESLAERLGGAPAAAAEPERRRRPRRAGPVPDGGEAIAIVAMAGRFPGAPDLDTFWANLRDGVETIRFFTDEELRAAGVDDALVGDPRYIRGRGVLDGVDRFDAEFFGYSPREAELIDPQQRLFLECASEALDRAGCDPSRFDGAIGVFAGASFNSYLLSLLADPQFFARADLMQAMTAIGADFLPTRVSYKLNLRGPSVNVQTACSTSLVAVHQACRSLLAGECDLALAGGVSVTVPVVRGRLHQEGGILAPDGHCRAFDAAAAGTVGGNGVAAVVLKRLSDAVADGDRIRAVIRGSAVNNDGAAKVGYTAPSVDGQASVIAQALAAAGVAPTSIGYVEAHGTGTALGDPIEVAALARAFGGGAGPRTCAIGSLKTNVGHLDAAAGVASLIKTVLALEHRQIPPSLHFERPNPEIDFERGPFYVNGALAPWDTPAGPRRAGVSSFGIGGTNAHVVLEEAPARGASSAGRAVELLPLSARTAAALERTSADLAEFLRARPDASLGDVAHTLQTGRRTFAHRRVVAARSVADAIAALDARDPGRAVPHDGAPAVAFLFSGQGAQHVDMGRGLYETERVFRDEIDRCCEALAGPLGLDLRRVLYPEPAEREAAAARLDETRLAQPALFVTELALARLWASWGIRPSAMIGHSIGEYVAACLAGVFAVEDALRLVAARGRLMASVAPGGMAAIAAAEAEVRALVGDRLDIAAVNGARQTVVAGPHAEIDALEARGVELRRLRTSHAFHSRMLAPIVADFEAELRAVAFAPPAIPFVSNVTGTWIRDDQATSPAYWVAHLTSAVRFGDGLTALGAAPGRLLLEVGPGQALTALARRHESAAAARDICASLPPASAARSDGDQMAEALGRLWLAGAEPDWIALRDGEVRHRVELPPYPFDRRRYWVDPASLPAPLDAAPGPRPLDEWFYVPGWRRAPAQTAPAPVGGRCLVFADGLGVGAAVAARLTAAGADVTLVGTAAGDHVVDPDDPAAYQRLIESLAASGRVPDRIVHLWSLAAPDAVPDLPRALSRGCFSVTRLVQAITAAGLASPLDLTVVTTGVQDVTGVEPLRPEHATVMGPCLVAPREHPHITCRAVDVLVDGPAVDTAAAIVAELGAGAADPVVAYRGVHRWVPAFEPMPLQAAAGGALRQQGVYLVTGGFGGVGLAIADYLVDACSARLVLAGRTGVPDRAQWTAWLEAHAPDDPVSATIRRLQAMEARGGAVLPVRADVADAARVRDIVAEGEARFGAIHGVVHAAGVAGGAVLQRLTPELARPVFAPKIDGTLALDAAFSGKPLDFFVLISSLVSFQALPGRADYTAAHAFLDGFARRAARTRPHVTAINMPTWRDVGMAAAMLAARGITLDERAADAGVATREGVEAIARTLGRPVPQIVVSPRDPGAAPPRPEAAVPVGTAPAAPEPARQAAYPRPQLATPYEAPRSPAEETLAAIWQGLLGLDRVGIHDDFFELGGDSVVSLQIIARAGQAGLKLTPKQVFERRTIAELAEAAALSPAAPPVPVRRATGDVALTPIQHWFFEQGFEDPHHFNQSSLLEVHGPLDRAALERAVAAVFERHDALRLRYERGDDGWRQRVADAAGADQVRFVDLSGLQPEEQAGALAREADAIQASLDLQQGPVCRAAVFDLGAGRPARLLIVAHHLVIDAISWRTVLEDLSAALDQARSGRAIVLPPAGTSLERWAAALVDHAASDAIAREAPYWLAMADQPVPPLPVDHDRGAVTTGSAQVVTVSLPADATRALLTEAPAAYNAQVNDLLLTALLRACAAWSGRRTLRLHVEGHGRHPVADDVDVSRTVGWFTTLHPLSLELVEGADPGAAIVAVKEQLREVPQHGFGYGLLRYLRPGAVSARLARAAAPEVLFLYFGQMDQARRYGALVPVREPAGRDVSPRAHRPYLLEVTTFVAGGCLQANWMASANRYRRETIAALAASFRDALAEIVAHCASAERRYTPSDFPQAGLDQSALDGLLAKLGRS